jgi:hypothetical protein
VDVATSDFELLGQNLTVRFALSAKLSADRDQRDEALKNDRRITPFNGMPALSGVV